MKNSDTELLTKDDRDEKEPEGLKLHMGIAEQGKVYALEGNHRHALLYYREAMQMAIQAGDPEVFFRHYLECTIESLEQTGTFGEVLAYCDKAIELYTENPPPNPMAELDLAHIYQKKGVVLLKMGVEEEALTCFREVMTRARKLGPLTRKTLPLSQSLLRWLETGLHVDVARVIAEQKQHGYFSVRKDTVNPKLAVKLPHEETLAAAGRMGA